MKGRIMKPRYRPLNDSFVFLEHYREYDLYFAPGPLPDIVAVCDSVVISGFLKGQSGEDNVLAYAYGLLKAQGFFTDVAEQEFLLNSAIGWLVVGVTGEHQDIQQWPAFFTLNKVRAEAVAMLLNKQAKTWAENRSNKYDNPPYGWSAVDPNMKCDFNGTIYSLQPIKHETDPNKISFALEICPECNSQVYDTPNGAICERGHVMP
jgi:hypothetical protein